MTMPGEVERLAPLSFYGSHKSTAGYCTRQTISWHRIGLRSGLNTSSNKLMSYNRMNGGKLRCNRVTNLTSNKKRVSLHQTASELAPRHCRYLNMKVRRLPCRQLAPTSSDGVNGSTLSRTRSPAAQRSDGSAVKKIPSMEKVLVRSRESRVLISAELKKKADSEMKNSFVGVHKSTDSARHISGDGNEHGYKKNVHRSDEVKKANGSVLEKSPDKGLQLRNGRSLPENNAILPEKLLNCIAGRQSGSNECGAKIKKKYHVQYRSRSLSPAKPLAVSRPRRSAITKRSVHSVLIG